MEDYRKHVRDWIEEINVDIDVVKKKMGHLKYCVDKLPVHKHESKKKTSGIYVTGGDFFLLGVKQFWVKDEIRGEYRLFCRDYDTGIPRLKNILVEVIRHSDKDDHWHCTKKLTGFAFRDENAAIATVNLRLGLNAVGYRKFSLEEIQEVASKQDEMQRMDETVCEFIDTFFT